VRILVVDVPLSPGYVCFEPTGRVRVLGVPGVVGFVEGMDGPIAVSGEQLETKNGTTAGTRATFLCL